MAVLPGRFLKTDISVAHQIPKARVEALVPAVFAQTRSTTDAFSKQHPLIEAARELAAAARARLLRVAGGDQGQRHANRRAIAGCGDQRDPPAELFGDEIMHDVEAKPRVAFGAARGEERVEHMTLNFLGNAAPIVGERDLDLAGTDASRVELHVPDRSVGEGVGDGIEDEVGQHLAVSARVAVERDVGGDIERKRTPGLRQAGPHGSNDLLRRELEVEAAPIRLAAIDGDLLERLNQFSRALEIGDELIGGIAATVVELGNEGTTHGSREDGAAEVPATVRERGGHREADADRAVELVRNASNETAECS